MFHSPFSLFCPSTDLAVNKFTNLSIPLAQTEEPDKSSLPGGALFHLRFPIGCAYMNGCLPSLGSSTSFLTGGGRCAARLHITQQILSLVLSWPVVEWEDVGCITQIPDLENLV